MSNHERVPSMARVVRSALVLMLMPWKVRRSVCVSRRSRLSVIGRRSGCRVGPSVGERQSDVSGPSAPRLLPQNGVTVFFFNLFIKTEI